MRLDTETGAFKEWIAARQAPTLAPYPIKIDQPGLVRLGIMDTVGRLDRHRKNNQSIPLPQSGNGMRN